MGVYATYVLPRLIHLACGLRPITRERGRVVPRARGRVLEIGIGSGLNLPLYDTAGVSTLHGLDPSPELLEIARGAADAAPFPVELVRASAEDMPFAGGSFDTVVATWTLCSIPDLPAALDEVRRVLRPGGEFLFGEHGRAPDPGVRRWQERLNPVWRRLAGGCTLDRDIPGALRERGFTLLDLDSSYITGWKPASYTFRGAARP